MTSALRSKHPLALLLLLATGCLVGSPPDATQTPQPSPAEAPLAWVEADVDIVIGNNPNTNVLCDDAGDGVVSGWQGYVEATLEDGSTLRVGDPTYADTTDFAYAECYDSAGRCASDAPVDVCEIFFWHEGVSPGGHALTAAFVLHVAGNAWVPGELQLASPTASPGASYGFAIVTIDGNDDGVISRDSGGRVLAPDAESMVGAAFEGTLALEAAGVVDGEAVIVAPATLTLSQKD